MDLVLFVYWYCYLQSFDVSKGVFTWENSHQRKVHTDMTFLFRISFTWWLGHFTSRYLKIHFMLIKCMCDSKSRTLHMHYTFQSTGRPISHRNGRSFRVYMIPLWDFVPEWNSCPGTRTRVNSRRGDSRQHEIVVVSCKQIWSHEREPEWTHSGVKFALVSCKHPLIVSTHWLDIVVSFFAC